MERLQHVHGHHVTVAFRPATTHFAECQYIVRFDLDWASNQYPFGHSQLHDVTIESEHRTSLRCFRTVQICKNCDRIHRT